MRRIAQVVELAHAVHAAAFGREDRLRHGEADLHLATLAGERHAESSRKLEPQR